MAAQPRRTFVTAGVAAPRAMGAHDAGGAGQPPTKLHPTSADASAASPQIDPKQPLHGKTAFITGGARGIGRASGIELARLSANIALFDIAQPHGVVGITEYPLATAGALEEAAGAVRTAGARALPFTGDVRRPAELQRAVDRTVAELGGIDILVADAGVHAFGDSIEHFDFAAGQAMIDVNLWGLMHTVRAALPAMRRRPSARIIFISSLGGRVGANRATGYQMTKWATQALMKALALELGKDGIAVNAIAPGTVDTPLHNKEKPVAQVAKEDLASSVLPVSIMAPEDIARAVGFLAGPGGKWMSGATLDVDAGRVAKNVA